MSDRSIVKAKSRRQALLVVVGVLAGLLQLPGVAAAGNLIQNADFTSDLSGWQPAVGSWTRSAGGFTGDLFAVTATGGSLLGGVASGNEYNKYSAVSQCIPLGPATTNGLYFEAWAAVEGYSAVGNGAEGIDAEAVIQTFTTPDCSGPASSESRGATSGLALTSPEKWGQISAGSEYPAGRKSVKVFLEVVGRFPFTHASVRFDKVFMILGEDSTNPASYPCLPGGSKLCLTGGRFKVEATWKTADGKSGSAHAVQLQSDSGYLWFFNQANIEMVVKVLNACSYNSRFWVYAGGLTDVEVTLTVTDTKTGATKTYKNQLGKPFAPIGDSSAFATCP